MDHSNAEIIDFNHGSHIDGIESKFKFSTKLAALEKSESLMQNKEQQMHEAYYKEISIQILNYEHVLLFGPTNAKTELHNYLRKDLHFKDIQIDIRPADKMTENEKYAFVKNHFDRK